MLFPKFPEDMRNAYLYQGVVDDIAERERDFATHYEDRVDPRSAALGRLCLEIVDGNEAADGWPDYAANTQQLSPEEVKLYGALSQVALYAYDTRRSWAAQQDLHIATVGHLKNLYSAPDDLRARADMAEYNVLGLMTRYVHPNMLAYPALQHHELDTDTPGHYDVGVIFSDLTGGRQIETNHLQVKLGCFGLCTDDGPNDRLLSAQAQYRPYVQLVSACCHLKEWSHHTLTSRNLAGQLIAERRGDLSRLEVKQLDNVTDSMLLAMTTEALPRGQHGGTSVELSASDFLSRL